MNRRNALRLSVAGFSLPWLAACTTGALDASGRASYFVEVWVDSDPEDAAASRVVLVASSRLVADAEHPGRQFLPGPRVHTLPGGLQVRVSCERVVTGSFHCGISHGDALVSTGTYPGPFTVRLFPADHSGYLLSVTDRPGVGPGA